MHCQYVTRLSFIELATVAVFSCISDRRIRVLSEEVEGTATSKHFAARVLFDDHRVHNLSQSFAIYASFSNVLADHRCSK